MQHAMRDVVEELGFDLPTICTPGELMGESGEHP